MKPYKMLLCVFVIMSMISIFPGATAAQNKKDDKKGFTFTSITEVKRTPVKNQYRTGTCWCFSTVSFLESELLRTGKGEFDLSEMFVVRHTYPRKALNYFRMHGKANHSEGGQAHDVIDILRQIGMAPEDIYTGMNIGETRHNHGEMVAALQGFMDAVLKKDGSRITPRWLEAYTAILDVYLGKAPESFSYKEKTYTPRSFANEAMGLNPDDYIELTSYTHHPFYQKCSLELPDNWYYNNNYYNVPIDDLEKIIDNSLKTGYSFVWDGDVSEREFESRKTGVAVVPEKEWEDKTKAEQNEEIAAPIKEKEITQELRQKTYDNFTTTDDHLMHIVGIAQDQNGNKYYLTKNSGGVIDRAYAGYVYLSRSYFRLKTTAVLIHKNALPDDMKKKLGIL